VCGFYFLHCHSKNISKTYLHIKRLELDWKHFLITNEALFISQLIALKDQGNIISTASVAARCLVVVREVSAWCEDMGHCSIRMESTGVKMCSNFVKTIGYEQLFFIKIYISIITKSDEENIKESDLRISSSSLMNQKWWLNVRQLTLLQSLMIIFKTNHERKPVYLYSKISNNFAVNTRLGVNNGMKYSNQIKAQGVGQTQLYTFSPVWRIDVLWNDSIASKMLLKL